jgi:23S rRNA A2030 N6-methylase RlmJ
VVTGIHEGYKRFATGTYALWYPVVLRAQIKRMINTNAGRLKVFDHALNLRAQHHRVPQGIGSGRKTFGKPSCRRFPVAAWC